MASTGLEIAASAINAATTEIAVTSENIANAQTPGYATQRAVLSPQPGGNMYGIGDGVAVTSVAQVTNALLSANNLQAQGALQSLTASQQVLTGIQNIFPLGQSSAATSSSSTGSSNTSIAGQLANFWSSWDAIVQNPSGSAARTQVVNQAQGLVVSLNEASTQLNQLATNTVQQLSGQVGQVNQLLQQAADLNSEIATTAGGGGSPNQLIDQLNQVVGKLGQMAGVSVQSQASGEATISIGGITLVQGNQATLLQLNQSNGQTASGTTYTSASVVTGDLFVGGNGTGTGYDTGQSSGNVPVAMPSGSIGGLLSGLGPEGSIATYQAQLNTVASDLASAVNNQLGSGYTAPGVTLPAGYVSPSGTAPPAPPTGQGYSGADLPLFVAQGGGTTVTASNISLNAAIAGNSSQPGDPALLAAAGATANAAGAGANDASNAQAMAELASSTTNSPDLAYQTLVENIGSSTQAVNSQVSSQSSVATQAQQAVQSMTGVNQNTELTNLMQFQQAYQASAKIVTVIDATVQSLLQAV